MSGFPAPVWPFLEGITEFLKLQLKNIVLQLFKYAINSNISAVQ
jgi:hypothetical protein